MNFPLGKTLLGTAFALAVLFFAVPIVVGGSTDICQDVEVQNVSTTASNIAGGNSGPMYSVINTAGQLGTTGNIEQQKQAHDHPHIPTVVSCASAFWHAL